MTDILEIYDLNENLLGLEKRNRFYSEIKQEFKKTGKITKQVKRINLFLMNSEGKIILQRRNLTKKENPGLLDKTVGGHVLESDTYNMTIIRECAEELGFPISILTAKEFNRAINKTNLEIVGLSKEIDYRSNYQSIRITKEGHKFIQPYMQTTYIGYYDGPFQFIDTESSGIQLYSIKELKKAINKNPDDFTGDLKMMLQIFEKHLKPILKNSI